MIAVVAGLMRADAARNCDAMKILIIGAGIAGLAIGWRLAGNGHTVEIVERGVYGRGATWASAGMIAPGAELGGEVSAVAEFARQARAKWPAFAKELEDTSGQPIFYREAGSLLVAETAAKADALEFQAAALARRGISAAWLPRDELQKREPLLSSRLLGALSVSDDAQVDNRALSTALCTVLENLNVAFHEHCNASSILVRNGGVHAAITDRGAIEADLIILASGAWMNRIDGLGPEDLPPIKPVKGQMAACLPPAGTSLPHSLIWAEDIYLVTRDDRLFVGATVEDAGFDISVSREACDRLLQAAARIVPSLRDWQLAEIWAGLRPRTPDDAPVLGPTAIAGLYIAGGQFRNGILFAPAVADFMRALVLGEPVGAAFSAFDPRRFARQRR